MKRVITLFAGVLVTLAALVGSAAAGSGSPLSDTVRTATGASIVPMAAPAGCDAGALCFWRDNNTSGGSNGPGTLQSRNSNWGAFSHASCQTGTWNNCASFAYNNGRNCNAVMWDGTGYTFGAEGALVLARNVGLDLPSVAFNDVASSNSWISPSNTVTSTCSGPSPF